jgi:hypothetical protein
VKYGKREGKMQGNDDSSSWKLSSMMNSFDYHDELHHSEAEMFSAEYKANDHE